VTQRLDEWLTLEQQAEKKAEGERDFQNAGLRAYQAGKVHVLRQQGNGALACADRAAVHWQMAQAGARERALAIHLRGLGQRLNKNYSAAIAAYHEAIDLYRTSRHGSEDLANVLSDLAVAESESGDFAAAERDFREALRVNRSVGNAEAMAISVFNLSGLALHRGDWQQAESLAQEALDSAERIGRQNLIAEACRYLAKARVQQGKRAEALPYAQRALEIYTQIGSPHAEAARATLKECEE
jgi:tetratricopeptide (TPR) repeat protein